MNSNELTNPQIVTLGLANLGGEIRSIDTEDIAIEAFRLAPQRFCWKKYPDKIDIAIVRFALTDAAKPPNPYITGNNKLGWMLNLHGIEWIGKLPPVQDEILKDEPRRGSTFALLEMERLRLRRTSAFTKYYKKARGAILLVDFHEFVRINEYFPARKRIERFTAVQNATAGDRELELVWEFLIHKFKKEFAENGE